MLSTMRIARFNKLLWIAAFIITLTSAAYQRRTGPTYPLSGSTSVGDDVISFKLPRSQTVNIDSEVRVQVPDTTVSGSLKYKRYKSYDEWTTLQLRREGENLVAYLPHQPAAGKIMYFVLLAASDGNEVSLSGEAPVLLRYKGSVPLLIIVPHVVIVFLAMLFSNRAGLEALDEGGRPHKLMLWTLAFFFIGGFILGPIMQQYAFGALWTGVPLGTDLTDNKVLIAFLVWVLAWYKNRGGSKGRPYIIAAALLMLVIYLIPHSLLGSELDYTRVP